MHSQVAEYGLHVTVSAGSEAAVGTYLALHPCPAWTHIHPVAANVVVFEKGSARIWRLYVTPFENQ